VEAVILIGIQASGKTTFYQRRFAETHVRISLDMLKTRRRERLLIEACIDGGQPFVLDNTNVKAADRARYVAAAKAAGFSVAGYFFEPDPRASFARNKARERTVPPAGLFGTLKLLERPTSAEGWDALFRVTIPAPGQFAVEPMPLEAPAAESSADPPA
jgi:predicted kinase